MSKSIGDINLKKTNHNISVGRRKSSVARVFYKNGTGMHEVLNQLHRQAIELEKLRSGEIGKRNLLLTE